MISESATVTAVDSQLQLQQLRSDYLSLVKRCLVNSIYQDAGQRVGAMSPATEKLWLNRTPWVRRTVQFFSRFVVNWSPQKPFMETVRSEGKDFPATAHSMIGEKRMDNLQFCIEDCLQRGVPGDLIETGVWRGGATILMRAILGAYGDQARKVWVADSFEGLPKPNARLYPSDVGNKFHAYTALAVSLEEVQENFRRYGLLDDQVQFLKGWFKDTLPAAPITQLAVARLDGDMYESTMDALVNLWPKLSVGGYLIIDDYNGVPMCKEAVDDFRAQHSITDEIQKIDWTGVFWKRSC
ncbi:MAG: TylF/MycF family methyltransferase [Planctomycetaceae bacterium]